MTDTPKSRTPRRRLVKQQAASPNSTDPDSSPRSDRDSPSTSPNEEEIRRRAYELYEQRGAVHGRDKEDWERAERELRGRD
jgi:hypothetical protein